MRDMTTRVLLAVVAVGNAVVGIWATAAPESFYENFPGVGQNWVALDGPYNEHLVGDVGALNLALAAVLVAAIVRPERYLVMVAAGAELVYSLPHFLYHLDHLDVFDATNKVAVVVSLGVTVIVPIVLLWLSSRSEKAAITTVA